VRFAQTISQPTRGYPGTRVRPIYLWLRMRISQQWRRSWGGAKGAIPQ